MGKGMRNDIRDCLEKQRLPLYGSVGFMKKVAICMPVANEQDTIKDFLTGLLGQVDSLDYSFSVYVVMDSFSKDNTFGIVKELSARDERIKPIFYERSTGVVSSYLKGFKDALSDGCDYIIEMDSGGSHPPSKIREILAALDEENYDVVFMSRFTSGAGLEGFPFYRRVISKGGTILANLWLGMHYSDATSGFEAFRAEVLRSFDLDGFLSEGGIYQTEMKYYCSDFKIKEIPFVYVASTTAFKLKWILIALKTLFRMRFNKARVLGGKARGE